MRFFSFGKPKGETKAPGEVSGVLESKKILIAGNRIVVTGAGSRLMTLQKPWGHRLVLHGMNYATAYEVLVKLKTRFDFGDPLRSTSYQESLAFILSEATKIQVGSKLHEVGFHRHELTISPGWKEDTTVSAERLKSFQRSGETVEIGYARERTTIAGGVRSETHIHRAKIIEVHDRWFRANNGSGLRNFTTSNVMWLKSIGFMRPQPPYFIDILLNMDGSLRNHKLGLFRGEDEGILEPYTALRTKGFYSPGRPGRGGARILPPLEEVESADD